MQELMAEGKHLQDQQDIADACSNYYSSVTNSVSNNGVRNKINDEGSFTCTSYLEQVTANPPLSFVIK
jgi:enolase